MLGEVRQGDVVAEQEGQAAVVVLEVERLAQSRRELVDEAKHALVAAGALLIHEIGLEFQPQLLVLGLPDLHGMHRAVDIADL